MKYLIYSLQGKSHLHLISKTVNHVCRSKLYRLNSQLFLPRQLQHSLKCYLYLIVWLTAFNCNSAYCVLTFAFMFNFLNQLYKPILSSSFLIILVLQLLRTFEIDSESVICTSKLDFIYNILIDSSIMTIDEWKAIKFPRNSESMDMAPFHYSQYGHHNGFKTSKFNIIIVNTVVLGEKDNQEIILFT